MCCVCVLCCVSVCVVLFGVCIVLSPRNITLVFVTHNALL